MMLRAFKTEIDPTKELIQVIHRTLGICRYIYNFYIAHNKEVYEKEKRFVRGMDLSKWLNNEFLPDHPEYCWIREVGSKPVNEGIGIDLGIKDFATVSSMEKPFPNINKTREVIALEKRLKREQRKLSRKYESLKSRNKEEKGEATRQNIQKQVKKVQKIHQRLSNIRETHQNQGANAVVKPEPGFISIEDLNARGMMKNRHLARAVSQQGF